MSTVPREKRYQLGKFFLPAKEKASRPFFVREICHTHCFSEVFLNIPGLMRAHIRTGQKNLDGPNCTSQTKTFTPPYIRTVNFPGISYIPYKLYGITHQARIFQNSNAY